MASSSEGDGSRSRSDEGSVEVDALEDELDEDEEELPELRPLDARSGSVTVKRFVGSRLSLLLFFVVGVGAGVVLVCRSVKPCLQGLHEGKWQLFLDELEQRELVFVHKKKRENRESIPCPPPKTGFGPPPFAERFRSS